MLKNGWVKLKELKREPTEEDLRRRELEAEAKTAKRGIWNPQGPQVSNIPFGCTPCVIHYLSDLHSSSHSANRLCSICVRVERETTGW